MTNSTGSGSADPPAADSPPLQELRPDPDQPPRPEEEVADSVRDQPVAGGSLGGEPVQGEGASDSYLAGVRSC